MGDLINRQDAIDDLISRKWLMEAFENYPFDTEKDKNRVIHVVRDTAPSAEPERKTGKWIVYYECPKCGEITKNFAEYCPFCGADMRGEEE